MNRADVLEAFHQLQQRAANYRHVVHRSWRETHTKAGTVVSTPGDVCEVTTHRCGVVDQLVEHRLSDCLGCVSVCSQGPSVRSRTAKSGVLFNIHGVTFAADDSPSPSSPTPPPSPSPLFHSR